MKQVLRIGYVVTLLAMAAWPVRAMVVKNLDTGTIIFSDAYEGVAASENAWPDPSGDYDPNADVGTWAVTEDGPSNVQVTVYGPPGAYEGRRYLRIHRVSGGGTPLAVGYLSEAQTTVGDRLRFTSRVRVSGYAEQAKIYVQGKVGASSRTLVTLYFDGGGEITSYDGASFVPTGLEYSQNEWGELVIDYAIGSTSFDLTYGGNTATDISLRTGALIPTSVDYFYLTSGKGYDAYFDAPRSHRYETIPMVRNLTSGQDVFADDFEEGTAGSGAWPDPSGDYDPYADSGTWDVSEAGPSNIQVTTCSPPGAYQGSQFLRIHRDAAGNPLATGHFTAAQTGIGDHLQFTWMVRVPGYVEQARISVVGLSGGSVKSLIILYFDGGGNITSYAGSGTGFVSTGLTYATDEWGKLVLDYVIGATSFDLTYKRNRVAGIPIIAPGTVPASVEYFYLYGRSGYDGYFDAAVPDTRGTVVVVK